MTGCTIEGRTVRPERVAVYIVGVAAVGLGTVAGFSLLVLLRLSMTPILMFILLGAVGKDVLVIGFVSGGTSARRAAAHDVAAVGWT